MKEVHQPFLAQSVPRVAEVDIEAAATDLAAGRLVAFPTETVYGLGARADQDAAVAQVFAAKGRPADHPLIVHVVDEAAAQDFAALWPPDAARLARTFWPGPLTLIVPRRADMAQAAAGGQSSIGLRCPAHPDAQALLAAARRRGVAGVAAPSANRFGCVSPTTAAHVRSEFPDDAAFRVLDGGPCEVGIESTIIDCTVADPMLLRPGILNRTQVEAALGRALADRRDDASPRASGTLASHYAPRAKVRLMPADQLAQALDVLGVSALRLAVYAQRLRRAPQGVRLRRMPEQAEAVAHELFAVLRDFDDEGAQLIWIEAPGEGPQWEGVRDRLQRAAYSS